MCRPVLRLRAGSRDVSCHVSRSSVQVIEQGADLRRDLLYESVAECRIEGEGMTERNMWVE